MKNNRLVLAAAVAAFAPLPTIAADPSCAVNRTTPEYRAELAQVMTQGDEAGRERLEGTLNAAVQICVAEAGYNEEQEAAYFDVVLSEISRGWLIAELAKAGLANTVIDKALDFGPGRTNPTLEEEITEAQVQTIVMGFVAANVDVEKVPQQAWEHVGAYAAATAIYWQAIGKLP